MMTPVVKFPSGRHFKVEAKPSTREFYVLFLDENELRAYFSLRRADTPPCVVLPLPDHEPWGKKGTQVSVILLSGKNRETMQALIASYPDLPPSARWYFLTPSTKKGCDAVLESDHLSCFYTLYGDRWYPVSYTPFQDSVIELEGNMDYDFVAFGSEANLTVAVLEGEEIHISPTFGRLVDWQQLESAHQWMENHTKGFTSKGVIFHEYYHESLLHTYLLRHETRSAYTHTEAHFASVLFDNHISTTSLLGVICDDEDHTSSGMIEGSDIVYGSMDRVLILASWRPIPVPGHASIALEPWRMTLAVLREVNGPLENLDIPFMRQMREKHEIHYVIDAIEKRVIHVDPSSSMTHVIISLLELLDYRALIEEYDMVNKRFDEIFLSDDEEIYEVSVIQDQGRTYLDTYELFRKVLADMKSGKDSATILRRALHSLFANTAMLVQKYADQYHEKRVALSGNLFVHPHFLQLMEHHLRQRGLEAVLHKDIPTGDSSVALGALLHILAQKEAKTRK